MDLKELESGVDLASHWYYRTKRIPVLDYLRRILGGRKEALDVLDVGAGSGFFSESLIDAGGRAIRDVRRVDTGYPAEASARDERIAGYVSRGRELPVRVRDSLVLMMDVLEHVKDPQALLNSVARRCEGTNYFFITTPAFMSLWSPHDVFLGHHRRYTLRELTETARKAGLDVTSSYYLYGAIFPAVWLVRRWKGAAGGDQSDMKPASFAVSALLELICRAEFVFRRLNKFAGVTCVVEATLAKNGA
jgi:SAM-dependent methyltransferase